MAPKQQLDKEAWRWAERTEPANIQLEHIEAAYRVNLKPCKKWTCRRNCKGNPKCLNNIGEREWFVEYDDSIWHDIEDPETERRQEGSFVGLKNLGATCYVNTFTQVWYHNHEFRNDVFSWRSSQEEFPAQSLKLDDTKVSPCTNQTSATPAPEPQPSGASQPSGAAKPQTDGAPEPSGAPQPNGALQPEPSAPTTEPKPSDAPEPQPSAPKTEPKPSDAPEPQPSCAPEPKPSCSTQTDCDSVDEVKREVATCAPNPLPLTMSDDAELMPDTVCGHLQLIFALLRFTNRRYIDPSSLINCLGLDAEQQQDAQEFSKLFMSVLEDQLSRDEKLSHGPRSNFIKDQFQGEYAYMTTCCGCKGISLRPSSFYELDLNIKGHKELKECIGEFLKEEKLVGDNQYMCNTCKKKMNATRKIKLSRLPKVLNLQLLRFVFDRKTGHKKKLNTYIHFPEHLDLSEYLNQNEGSIEYELMAVLIHRGPSAYSGHYIAHIKDPESLVWHKFNDEETEKMGGKNLQLGNEEDIEGKGPKRPRTSKGFHCSRNAYMLVYRQVDNNKEPVPETTIDMLPEKVKLYVDVDKRNFDEWVNEMKGMRDVAVNEGRAQQKEIQELYDQLYTKPGEESEWISTSWLQKWFTEHTATTVPAIDNAHLLCAHGKMDPDKVTNAKCISSAVAEHLYSKYSGGPRLKMSEALCRTCIVDRCTVIRLKARVAEDQKVITASLKTVVEGNPESYWVGKSSLRSWRRLAMEKVKDPENSNGQTPNNSERNGGSEDRPAGDGHSADDAEEESFLFNEDIVCEEHGHLVLEEGPRRLVTSDVWQRLRQYFPDCAEFKYTSPACEECRLKKDNLVGVQEAAKVAATQQKAALSDLYNNRNRPTWGKASSQFNVVSSDFLDSWRRFVKEPGRYERVTAVSNSSLICPHGGFFYNPQTLGLTASSQKAVYVWPAEWTHISQLFEVDVMVSVVRLVEDSGQVSFITSPDICDECHTALEEAMRRERSSFTDEVIFVRKLTSENKDVLPPGALPDNHQSDVTDESKDDPEFSHTENGKRKRKDGESVGQKVAKFDASCQSRRSSRHRKMRGEKEFTVSANNKLWDLKIKVMKAYSAPPMDQHFYLDGRELVGDETTLAELGILPSSILYLRIDEPCDDPMLIDDMSKASSPEKGFKGTGLLGGL